MFVDSHCHFSFNELGNYKNSKTFIERAKKENVKYMLDIVTDISGFISGVEFSNNFDGIFTALGVHPCHIESDTVVDFNSIEHFYNNKKVIAVGEIGLDKYRDASLLNLQKEIFRGFCELSIKLNLPICVHTRNAEEETIDILKEFKGITGVIHCFSGSIEFAKDCLDLGFYLSASGITTFKNANDLRDIFKKTPIEKILLETDAPYLAPTPHRGKINESSYIPLIAKVMAEVKEFSIEQIAEATTNNFFTLFKKAYM